MPRNKASDMLNLLFAQMERLDEASHDELEDEIKRAKALSNVATQVNNTYAQAIKARQVQGEYGGKVNLLGGSDDEVD